MRTDDRQMPHDLAAERAVLGAVLVSPEYMPYAREWLRPGDFYRQAHAMIWRALLELDEQGTAIDLLTLRARLEQKGELVDAGDRLYLYELTDGVPRSSNVEHYAGIVRRTAERRARILIHTNLAATYYEDPDDDEAAAAQAAADSSLAALELERDRGAGLLDADAQIAAIEADLALDRSGAAMMLGLPAIDDVLGGVRPGEVLDLWARPGIGKTLLLCHAAISITEWRHAVVFSLEMPAAQIVRRLARMAFGLTNRRLKEYGFPAADYRAKFERLTVDATPGLTVAQLDARVRRLQQTGVPIGAVFVDHLGLIGGDRKLSTYDRTSLQARELKELAKRRGVGVIRLVQVSRDAGGDGSRELHLGSARDSGVVEETADYILGFRRLDRALTLSLVERERFRDVLFGKVIKHRHGGPPDREYGYRIDDSTIVLREDLSIHPEAGDLEAIARMAGARGRR